MFKLFLLSLAFFAITACGFPEEETYVTDKSIRGDNSTASFSMNWEAEMGYPVEQL
jgi:hypothetical protein